MKTNAKIIGLALAILFLFTKIVFSYPSVSEGKYTLGKWYEEIKTWFIYEKPSAYDFKVHPWLALRAIQLVENNGTSLTDEQKKLIILGSIEEDYDLVNTSSESKFADVEGSIESTDGDKLGKNPTKQCERALNHFMDKDGKGLHEILSLGASALDWATSDEKNSTRYDEAVRLAKSGDKTDQTNGWRFLGHVLHLLQDMATPAHVRNDQHLSSDTYEDMLSSVGSLRSKLDNSILGNYDDLMPSLPDALVEGSKEDLFNNLSKYTRSHYYSDNSFGKSGYDNPSLKDGGDGYCYTEINSPYKQGVAYHIKGKNCKYAKIDAKTVRTIFPDLASKAIAYGAGLIKLFVDATKTDSNIQNFSGVKLTVAGEFIKEDAASSAVPVPVDQWQFASSFSLGKTITGFIAYEPNQPDIDPSSYGTYRIGTLSVNIPELGLAVSRSSSTMQISVFDNTPNPDDQFFAHVDGVDSFSNNVGLPNPVRFWVLFTGNTSMLANDLLPTSPLDWFFGNVSFHFIDTDGKERQVLLTFYAVY